MSEVGVVIVTYNRVEKLKKALNSYEMQRRKPCYLMVINNASTDDTEEFLKEWEDKTDGIIRYVFNLKENLGGSGGFCEGLRIAGKLAADWILVTDDDAYADEKAIEILEKYIDELKEEKVSAICGSVWTNNQIDIWHRRRFIKKAVVYEQRVKEKEYEKSKFEIDFFSYVGTALAKEALLQVGLPKQNYFIAYDDSEHSLRMRKYGKLYCVPAIKIVHDTTQESVLTWKTYYGIRNKISAYLEHMGKMQALIWSVYYFMRFAVKGKIEKSLVWQAVLDAWQGKLGKNEVYKPGWKE